MTAPNMASPSTIYGKSTGVFLSAANTSADVLTAATGKVLKVNTIMVPNITTSAVTVVVGVVKSGGTTLLMAKDVSVPAGASLDILGRAIYLEEGDKLTATASTGNALYVFVSYEEIS